MITLPGFGDFLINCIKSAAAPPSVGKDIGSVMDTVMETVLSEPNPDMQHPNVQENDVPQEAEV